MKKVVVFVDDTEQRDAVLKALKSCKDMSVEQVSNATDIVENAGSKSIVLTNLPDSDLNLLRQIRECTSVLASPSVVILTSRQNEPLAVKALLDGAASYVPVRLIKTELVKTLNSVFDMLNARNSRTRILECMTDGYSEFVLENDSTLVGPLTKYLQESARRLLCNPSEVTRMGIAIEEALLNSMYHGNLEVDSSLREEDDARFYELIEQRRQESPYKDRRVTVTSHMDREQAKFVITDEGHGFDVGSLPDPSAPMNVDRVSGRGVLLMRTFMDEVEYNDRGNQVTMIKRKQSCDLAG